MYDISEYQSPSVAKPKNLSLNIIRQGQESYTQDEIIEFFWGKEWLDYFKKAKELGCTWDAKF